MTVFDVVLVTGANGGLGTHFVEQALERGARIVYATARTPREWDDSRIVPLTLDVTDPASVAAAAASAADVTLVVNNAGSSNGATVLNDNRCPARPVRREPLRAARRRGSFRSRSRRQRRRGTAQRAVRTVVDRHRRRLQRHQGRALVSHQHPTPRPRRPRHPRDIPPPRLHRHAHDGRPGRPQERSGRHRSKGLRRNCCWCFRGTRRRSCRCR